MPRAEATRRGKPGVSADLDPPPLVRGPPVNPTPQLAMSIPQFAEAHGISASMYFKLKKQGLTPREMKVGSRTRAEREAASNAKTTAGSTKGRAATAGSLKKAMEGDPTVRRPPVKQHAVRP